jgi:hypothetical protein
MTTAPSTAPSPWPWRLFGLDHNQLSPLEAALLLVAALVTLAVGFFTLLDATTFGGVDFRNRVVGARVMLAGHDPYTFVWRPGMPEEWLDPVHEPKVHRLTAPPPTLWLYVPLSPLSYRTQRLISFVCEWAALIASVCILVRSLPRQRHRVVFLLGTVLFLVASDIWRLHIERGQVYVFHLLALSIAIHLGLRRDLDSIAAGVALGALALMRPNLLVFAPALLVIRRWRTAVAMCGSFGIGVLATVPAMHPGTWSSYLAMGERYYVWIWVPQSLPDIAWADHPSVVEGFDFSHSLHNVASSSFAVLYQTWHERGVLPEVDVGLVSKALMVICGAMLLAVLHVRRRQSAAQAALAVMVAFALDTEFFLPHRWGYVDVMLLAPVALMLPALLQPNRAGIQVPVLVGLIAGQMGQHFMTLYAATVLRSWLVMGVLTALAVVFWLDHAAGADTAEGELGQEACFSSAANSDRELLSARP